MLGYKWNGSARIEHVPEEWRGVTSVVTPSGTQEMASLSEQGLYFFLNRSDKPAALPMQKWVAGEVLPTIRKTGGVYLSPEKAEDLICNPDLIIGLAALVLSFQFESWVCLALFFMRRKIPARVAHQALPQGLPPGAFQRNERQQGVRSACSFF